MQSIADQLTDEQVVNGHDACELGYPWVTREAIRFIDGIVQADFRVLECGAGGSTVYFAKKGCTVFSIESDAVWCNRVRGLLPGPQVVRLAVNDSFISILQEFKDDSFDIVSVDSDPKLTNRFDLVNVAVPKVKKGGWLMLDNYNTFGVEKFVTPEGWEVHKFDQAGWAGSGTAILRKR